jgi:thioester reductase-like protein
MSAPSSLDRLLVAQADQAPGAILYRVLGPEGAEVASLTAADLLAQARSVAAALVELGAVGHPVLVCVGPGADQPVALSGCYLAGAIAVPVYPPPAGDAGPAIEVIATVARASGARLLIGAAASLGAIGERLAAALGPATPRLLSLEDAVSYGGSGPLPGGDPARPAVVLYTSGSTGAPKGGIITHGGFVANLRALASAARLGGDEVIFAWLPQAHIAGMYLRSLAVLLGVPAVVLPPAAFAARPTLWLELMSRHRATVTAAPDFAYALSAQLFSDEAARALDLSRWKLAVSGGEMVRASTIERFNARFAASGFRPAAHHPYYGLTETLCTAIATGGGSGRLRLGRAAVARGLARPPAGEDDLLLLVGHGAPLGEGTEVLAVDPETLTPAREGVLGELWTRGPAVTPGYFGDSERTAEACEARLADGAGPYFRTGDLGLVHEGQVYVTGRLKELIIVRGKNHYPIDIEATAIAAAAALGAIDAAAFALLNEEGEEALGLAIELREPLAEPEALLRPLRRLVASRHGLAIHRLFLLAPGALPRTTTRKVSRHACRKLVEAGAWESARPAGSLGEAAAASSDEDRALRTLRGAPLRAALLGRVGALIAAAVGGEAPADALDRPVADLGIGSIDVARIAASLRAATGVEPPLSAFFDGSSPRSLVERLAGAVEGDEPAARPDLGWRPEVFRVALSLPDQVLPRRSRPGRVLLTGGTGFLGAWILGALLDEGREVECLVRAPDEVGARRRLVAALASGPGWDPAWEGRLSALVGDASRPRLGLAEPAWSALAERTADIVHNAANVNFVAPYAALRASNVAPIHEVIELATRGGEGRALHHVSTTAVFNTSLRREQRRILSTDRLTEPDHLYSGYAQSKWVAESMVRAAGLRALPVRVHRPGVIIGDSRRGRSNRDDFLCRFLKGCVELGRYPDADIELDLVPVDDVGRGIAAAVTRPHDLGFVAWQWTCPNRVRLEDLFAAARRLGHAVEPERTRAWLARVRSSLPPDNALFPVHTFLLERPPGSRETLLETFDGVPLEVDAVEADAIRRQAGLAATPVDGAVLDRMLGWMESSGFLPPPRGGHGAPRLPVFP